MAHTPGPWRVIKGKPRAICNAAGNKYIAKALLGGTDHPSPRFLLDEAQAEANARLIAAAPEMLDALKQALLYIEGDEAAHGRQFGDGNAVRAALAKAEART